MRPAGVRGHHDARLCDARHDRRAGLAGRAGGDTERKWLELPERVGRIRAPMLFLHSPEDAVIPISEGRRLYEAAPVAKQFVEVRGGHVYASEVDSTAFYAAVRSFLSDHALLPARE